MELDRCVVPTTECQEVLQELRPRVDAGSCQLQEQLKLYAGLLDNKSLEGQAHFKAHGKSVSETLDDTIPAITPLPLQNSELALNVASFSSRTKSVLPSVKYGITATSAAADSHTSTPITPFSNPESGQSF